MKKIDDYLEFLLQETGEDIIVQGEMKKALISNAKDKINFYNDKFIRADFEIRTGDLIEYQNNTWIVISEVHRSRLCYKARIRRSNYRVKIIVDEVLCEWDTIIEGMSFGMEQGKFMNFEDGKIEVTVPANAISNNINADMRFIKMGRAWKVVGVDKSKVGLNILHCEKDMFVTDDDKNNEIANKNKLAVWEIQANEENRQVAIDKDFAFTATIKKNGREVTDQTVVWESSDVTIATVQNGIVDGIALGNVVISVFIQDKPTVRTSVNVEVIESFPDIITFKMWCSYTDDSDKSYEDFAIFFGAKYYGVEKYVNGVLVEENDIYTFTLDPNGIPSKKYVFSIIDDYKCQITYKDYHYPNKLILTATSNENGEIIQAFIELQPLW
ncbi:MAG TPA: hypothetical protein GX707_17360 [Epulopiscium sp.]|nr:hypothetical protein [Candidatus Epulonipiscium sp.]